MELKPFDLEKALAGEPVITKSGKKLTQLHLFDLKENPVCGVLDNNEILRWGVNGINVYHNDLNLQLFMAPKSKKLWIAVNKMFNNYYYEAVECYSTSLAYSSLKEFMDVFNRFSTEQDGWIIKEIEVEI